MKLKGPTGLRPRSAIAGGVRLLAMLAATAVGAAAQGSVDVPFTVPDTLDPRFGLRPGWMDAEALALNMELLASLPPPANFLDPEDPGGYPYSFTDIAFRENLAFVGNYNGFLIYDVADPANPRLRSSFVCPGGQGDVTILGDLLFVSVEETRARVDCGDQGTERGADPARFLGVRIFDVSDVDAPRQVAAVQTCRGSHTHTLVTDPRDPENVYVYVSGTGRVRPELELAGCTAGHWTQDPETAYWRIEVVQVPLAAPQEARIVNRPRIFADPETGAIGGLWDGGPHGAGTQESAQTNQCHDITAFPEIGLAAGACSGNGLLFDISDPVNPRRIDQVVDPNFAYWHSATFNNDGSKVVFTDEWGGGAAARCRVTDPPTWGANAIFDIVDGKLRLASYYKLPAPQAPTENCVAHNGSLVPVPGRDIMVQAWYQGGISVFDFTDSAKPVEIAYFDRGPIDDRRRVLGGFWSAYWYNGAIYGSEIARGLDILRLTPSEHLSASEIEAANLVRLREVNPQHQAGVEWPATFAVARAYLDQIVRGGRIDSERTTEWAFQLESAERLTDSDQRRAVLSRLTGQVEEEAREEERRAGQEVERLRALSATLSRL